MRNLKNPSFLELGNFVVHVRIEACRGYGNAHTYIFPDKYLEVVEGDPAVLGCVLEWDLEFLLLSLGYLESPLCHTAGNIEED